MIRLALLLLVMAVTAACDKAQLLAPTRSTITVSAPARFLPPNGRTTVTALVMEEAGTPVHNGTTVRFTTSIGRIDPVEVQTTNGVALTTFFADNASGVARIQATSGGGGGGEDTTNVIEITVGAAAVNTVTLRANPGSVSSQGGTVDLIATVVGENGEAIEGIGVTFNADQGTLSSSIATTNASGEARTQLTTTQQTIVSATAGTKTSTNLTVAVRSAPIVTIACAPSAGTGNCAALQASGANNTATVILTVTRPTGSSTLRNATLDFGDGTSANLGNLAGGTATVTHAYAGTSDQNPRVYTATVQATDINGETSAVSTNVVISPRAALRVTVTDTAGTATASGQRFTFTATVAGVEDAAIESFEWEFGDGSSATTSGNSVSHVYDTSSSENRHTVTVEVRTVDGRTAVGRTEILVAKFP